MLELIPGESRLGDMYLHAGMVGAETGRYLNRKYSIQPCCLC